MNFEKAWELKIDKPVFRQLSKFPRKNTERIFEVIKSLAVDPFAGDIEKMKGEENTWRRRVGSYRILYEVRINEKIINVAEVGRRTSKTY